MARPSPAKHGLGARPSVKGAPSAFAQPSAVGPSETPSADRRGAAGRSFRPRKAGDPETTDPQGFAPGGGAPAARGPAPFANYGPDARQMAGGLEGSRSQSRGVLAIVGGLVFMAASTFVILFAVLLVMLWWTANQRAGDLANGEDGPQHIRDTGFADPQRTVRHGPGPRNPGDPGDGTNRDPNFIPPGPSTVVVSRDMMFHSIEINCPGGYRNRGRFKNVDAQMMSATVPNVPGDESCVVTFQGSEPAKTYIRGNERKICKFNPVECYMM